MPPDVHTEEQEESTINTLPKTPLKLKTGPRGREGIYICDSTICTTTLLILVVLLLGRFGPLDVELPKKRRISGERRQLRFAEKQKKNVWNAWVGYQLFKAHAVC